MAKKKARDIHTIALELLDVRQQKNELTLQDKVLSKELRDLMDKGEKQDIFTLIPIPTLKIVDIKTALIWAQKDAPQLIKLDTSLALKWFRMNLGVAPELHGMKVELRDQLREKKNDYDEENGDIIN